MINKICLFILVPYRVLERDVFRGMISSKTGSGLYFLWLTLDMETDLHDFPVLTNPILVSLLYAKLPMANK